MALGAYYVQTQIFSWLPVAAAAPVGLLIAAVLFINEFPDYKADKAVGKSTWVVRLGRRNSVLPFAVTTLAANAAVIAGVVIGYLPAVSLLALLTLPASVIAIRSAAKSYGKSFDLAPANALTVIGHLAVGLAITWAFAWQGAGGQAAGVVAVMGIVFLGFVAYMYWHVEHQKKVFHGLKGVVERKA